MRKVTNAWSIVYIYILIGPSQTVSIIMHEVLYEMNNVYFRPV